MSKNPKNWWKSMKIANIDREILHNFWTTWAISMKFSGKMCLVIILKVTKNQGFTLCLEDIIFEKPQGVSNWPLPPLPPTLPAVLGLKRGALDVDLEYPKELRELHNDYPLAPDKTN